MDRKAIAVTTLALTGSATVTNGAFAITTFCGGVETGSGLAGVVSAALVGEDVPPVIQNSTTTMIATTTAEMATETSVRRLRRRRWLWRQTRCADDPWLVGEDISPESTSATSPDNGAPRPRNRWRTMDTRTR